MSEGLFAAGEQIALALGNFLAAGDVEAFAAKFATVAADWDLAAASEVDAIQKARVALKRTNELVQLVRNSQR